MRVPTRKGGEFTNIIPDPNITQAKFNELSAELKKLKEVSRPKTIKEVRRLAEFGDFSENAAYQMAKGKLRGINNKIEKLEDHLKSAVIIKAPTNHQIVSIGSKVTVTIDGQEFTYQILGSSEIDVNRGIISYQSPLGSALMNRKVGEKFVTRLGEIEKQLRIINII